MTESEQKTSSKREHTSELTVQVPLFSNFYQDQYRRAVFTTAFITLTNLICVFLIIFLLLQKPADTYIPADYATIPSSSLAISDYTITPKIPMDQPNFQEDEMNQWVLNTVIKLFTYDVQEYPQELRDNQNFFLPEAQNEYLTILHALAPLGEYTQKEVIVSTVYPKGAPVPNEQGVASGRYFWVFDIPIDVQFSGSVNLPSQSMTLRIVVVRTSMESDVDGVKIASITTKDLKKSGSFLAAQK